MKNKKFTAFRSCFNAAKDRIKWLTLIYFIYSFVCLALGILLSLSLRVDSFMKFNIPLSNLYSLMGSIEILAIIFALISSLWLFGKYTNYVSSNLIKSLPARDKHLFWSDYIAGLLSFVIPVLISLVLQITFGGLVEHFSAAEAYSTFGVSYAFLLNFIFSYSIAALCFAISNGVLESGILFFVLNFIPSLIDIFVNFIRSSALGLYEVSELAIGLKLRTSYDVIKGLIAKSSDSISYIQLTLIILVVVLLSFAISAFAYFCFTKLRSKGQSSQKLKKAISTFSICVMSFYIGFLILFFRRTGISLFNAMIFVPTMITSSFFIYFVANCIINRTMKLPGKYFLPYLPVVVCILLVSGYYFTGGYGQIYFIPQANEIESITVNFADENYSRDIDRAKRERFTVGRFLALNNISVDFPVTYSDYKAKYAITKYHKRLLNEYGEHDYVETVLQADSNFPEDNPRTILTYKLKNGKKLTRYYNYNGNEITLNNLRRLHVFENSVKTTQSEAKVYANSAADDSTHVLQIYPVFADKSFSSLTITDQQQRELVKAILADEKHLTDEQILSQKDGDYCTISFFPTEKDDQNPYFINIFNIYTENYFFVKKCYTNTIDYLKTLGIEQYIQNYPASSVKQVLIGDWYNGIYTNSFNSGNSTYLYNFNGMYFANYFGVERYYNLKSIQKEELENVDGNSTNSKAIEFLISKLKLTSNTSEGGKFVVLNTQILTPFDRESGYEERVLNGNQIYYITREDYDEYQRLNIS